MRFLRAFVLFVCALGLLSLAGFVLGGTALQAPAALAGFSSLGLALV